WAGARRAVLYDPYVVVELEAITRGPQDTHVGIDARDQEGVYAQAAQQQVQVRTEEAAIPPFHHPEVTGGTGEFADDLDSAGALHAMLRHWLVAQPRIGLTPGIHPAGTMRFLRVNHRYTRPARGRHRVGYRRDDVTASDGFQRDSLVEEIVLHVD